MIDRAFPFLASFSAIMIWALLPILTKSIVAQVNVSFFLVQRFFFSTLILSWLIPKIIKKIKFIDIKKFIFFVVILGSNFYLQTWALSQVPATWYVVVFALNPILTLLLLRHNITSIAWIGIIFAIIGTYLFGIGKTGYLTEIKPISIIALLGGMCTWSIYTVLIKNFHAIYSDLEITALSTIIAFLANLNIWGISGFPMEGFIVQQLPQTIMIGLVVPTAYFLYSYGMRKLPIVMINAQYLEPIFSLIFASFILHEILNNTQYVASIIIIIGTMLASKTSLQR